MARATYVIRDGKLVERHLAAPHPLAGRRLGVAPYIRTDGMDALRSMADGRMYDSKSAYYASVRAAGCEIVGDDRHGFGRTPGYDLGGVEQDIKQSIEQLQSGAVQPAPSGPVHIGGWD